MRRRLVLLWVLLWVLLCGAGSAADDGPPLFTANRANGRAWRTWNISTKAIYLRALLDGMQILISVLPLQKLSEADVKVAEVRTQVGHMTASEVVEAIDKVYTPENLAIPIWRVYLIVADRVNGMAEELVQLEIAMTRNEANEAISREEAAKSSQGKDGK